MASPQSSYDPLSPTPYEAQPLPPQPPPPEPAQPTPSPLGDQPGGFQFPGHGNISHTGAVAGMLDNVMRGYVNGKSMGEAKKALVLKKKSDDLNASYTADAERLWTVTQKQIAQNGKVDENSDEFKAAKSAVDGSWGALQDFRGSLLDDGKKKGKGKQDQRTPAEVLSDPKSTPQEKAAALHGMSSKLGPPIYGQIQNYAAQAQARAQRPEVVGATETAQTNEKLAGMAKQMADLETIENPTDEQKAQLDSVKQRYRDLKDTLTTPKVAASQLKRYRQNEKGEWLEYQVDAEGKEVTGTERPISSAAQKPRPAWGKDSQNKFYSVLLDPETNQEVPGSHNYNVTAPASIAGSIHTGQHFWVDNLNQVQETPYTATSRTAGSAGPATGPTTPSGAQTPPQRQPGAAAPPQNVAPPPAGTAPPQPAAAQPPATPVIPKGATEFMAITKPRGLVEPGNIPIWNRPSVANGDGTHSSEYSVSFQDDKGHEVLVPTVVDGKFLTPDGKKPAAGSPEEKAMFQKAWNHYEQTGQNLGKFANAADADAYAKLLHSRGATSTPKSVSQPRPPAKATPSEDASTSGNATGTKTLGHAKISGPDAKELNDATTQYHLALKSVEESRNAVRDKLEGKNVSLADKGIALAWIHSRMSRITQKEIDAVNKLGGLQMALDGAEARIIGGEMSNAQRAEFLRGANEAYADSLKDLNDVRSRLSLPPIAAGKRVPPQGASDEVYSADGKTLLGHVVNGQFVALGK